MSGYTPGPWNAIPRADLAENGNVIVESSCEVICHVYNDNNANLIAAAPALLAALRECRACMDSLRDFVSEGGSRHMIGAREAIMESDALMDKTSILIRLEA